MTKKYFNLVLLATLISAVILSISWEFVFEDFFGRLIDEQHQSETLSHRLEYIVSITVFVAMSLIIPAIVGHRLIENQERLNHRIKRLSEEDYLTKLSNRRKIHKIIESEITRSKRYNSTFALIMLDIDNFKTTNDSFGHNAGDKVLVQISETILKSIRESDIASRWGGEEFLVFCPHTNVDGAFSLAEKLRNNIEKTEFEGAGYKTASLGVTHVEHGDTVQSLINRADKALYSAKHSGKNMVMAAK